MKTDPSTCMHTGASVLYTILIFASRRAILGNEPTSLSSALGFLVRCALRVIHRTKPHNPHCTKLAPHTLARHVALWMSSDYKPTFMWWELLILWRQLWLVGFAILIMPGTVEQLVICYLVVLSHMLMHAVAMPFKDDGDNYIGQVCVVRAIS